MRNKKLLTLQLAAEKSFGELTAYLHHIDKREKDANYVHARMLFDEGWRILIYTDAPAKLWMDTEDGEESPVSFEAADMVDNSNILAALQMTEIDSSTLILQFLNELTVEEGRVE
jgi:hypothetical protein